jgi:hypothetical protein
VAYDQLFASAFGLVVLATVVVLDLSAFAQTSTITGTQSKSTGEGGVSVEARNGSRVTLLAEGATRRQALDRLFAARDVEIIWKNRVFADERVHGQFQGTRRCVARWLLSRRSYIITYDTSGEMLRTLRIFILGPDPSSVTKTKAIDQPDANPGLPRSGLPAPQRR